MAAFSYLFLNRSIEKWMGRLPENVVEQVREQQRENLSAQNKKLRETATLLATTVRNRPRAEWQAVLDQLAATGELSAIEVVSDKGEVIAQSQAVAPAQQAELATILERGRQSIDDSEALADGKGFDLAVAPLTPGYRLLFVPNRLGDTNVNDTIAGSQQEYRHLVQRQRKVRA